MAVNLNPAAAFQSAGFGFAPAFGGRDCEILNLMATPHHRGQARATYGAFIRDFGYGDLVARGFGAAYSTCTRRRLRAYRLFGATVLDQTTIRGEERYFLRWPIRDLLADGRSSCPFGTWPGEAC